MKTIGWIGLGVMGGPMAGHLAEAGHDVIVYNRSPEKAKTWVERHKGQIAANPAEVASVADVVFSCVGNDDDLRDITLGVDGAFSTLSAGKLYIDCTTTSADIALELAVIAAEKEAQFFDAPVSGGQAGAESGQLTVMVGGNPDAFETAAQIMEPFSHKVTRIGNVGAGQTAKMVNQLCIAGIVQGLSEGMSLAQLAGLNIPSVMETIAEGAAGSWQLSNRWQTMAAGEYEFGFAVDWMRKDLDIALEEVAKVGGSAPLGALVNQFYADVQRVGGGRWDTSSLLTRL